MKRINPYFVLLIMVIIGAAMMVSLSHGEGVKQCSALGAAAGLRSEYKIGACWLLYNGQWIHESHIKINVSR